MSNIIKGHAEFVNNNWADEVVGQILTGDKPRDIKELGDNIMPLKWAGAMFNQRLSDAFAAAKIVQNVYN